MLTLTTAPAATPVTLAEAKAHLRVTTADEDTLITALIEAATEQAEHLMQRAVMDQQWTLTLDSFSDPSAASADTASAIELRRPTVTAVVSVQYLEPVAGVLTTLAGSLYTADLSSPLVARLVPAYNQTWPDTRAQIAAVQVRFSCGWLNAAAVPATVKAWIKLRIGALYENREAWTLGKSIESNDFIDHLLDRHRIFTV